MTREPVVSVLLPARDCGGYLAPAVDSVLKQTFGDLELIVIDDHSRDGAVQALDQRDPRLRIMQNPGRGIVAALNAGAAAARGAYLARMDGDDIAHRQRITTQLAYLEDHPRIGIAGTQVEIFTDGGAPAQGYALYQDWINGLLTPEAIAREIFVESPIPHPSAMLRRCVFDRLGGYHDTPWAEDYDLWLRAFAAGIAMGKPRGKLLRWRDAAQRLSRRDLRYGREQFICAKARYLACTALRGRRAVIWGAGPTGTRLCDALIAEGAEVSCFVDVAPRRVGGRKRGRSVYGPEAIETSGRDLIIGAVAARGGRQRIRDYLRASGRSEGHDFLLAA